jgi:hypothetical protein
MLSSVFSRNHFVILGCTVVITIIMLVVNTLADILNAMLNPQIRLQYAKPSGSRPGIAKPSGGRLGKEAAS